MFKIGFSTGALAKGDIASGIEMARELGLPIIELSALRLREMDTLVNVVAAQDLVDFEYVALHAPATFGPSDEKAVVDTFAALAQPNQWPVIVHPDAISNFELWRPFESLLYVENMDKRKPRGRTVEELEEIFTYVPNALMCFDIAHARQVDSSMTEAYRILRNFRDRIRHLHFSEVGSDSRHRQVSDGAFRAYSEISSGIPCDLPVVLESVVSESETPVVDAECELKRVTEFLAHAARLQSSAKAAVPSRASG
jgi:sugar phosphate isomerase/epimerase